MILEIKLYGKYLFLFMLLIASPSFAKETPAYEIPDVSIISLIANPEAFNGKRIRVSGYCVISLENCAVYFSKDNAQYFVSENAVWINFGRNESDISDSAYSKKLDDYKKFNDKYVRIEGIFDSEIKGRWDLFAGQFSDLKIELIKQE